MRTSEVIERAIYIKKILALNSKKTIRGVAE